MSIAFPFQDRPNPLKPLAKYPSPSLPIISAKSLHFNSQEAEPETMNASSETTRIETRAPIGVSSANPANSANSAVFSRRNELIK